MENENSLNFVSTCLKVIDTRRFEAPMDTRLALEIKIVDDLLAEATSKGNTKPAARFKPRGKPQAVPQRRSEVSFSKCFP